MKWGAIATPSCRATRDVTDIRKRRLMHPRGAMCNVNELRRPLHYPRCAIHGFDDIRKRNLVHPRLTIVTLMMLAKAIS